MPKEPRRFPYQPLDDPDAESPAVKSKARLVADDLVRHRVNLSARDVGRVADQQVNAAEKARLIERCEQVTLSKLDPILQLKVERVARASAMASPERSAA